MGTPPDETTTITQLIYQLFEAGRRGDFTTLASLHLKDARFSKFDDFPPFRRLNYEETTVHEQLAFASISDFTFRIRDLKIDQFEAVAVATFVLEYGGVLVNSYTFEGKPLRVKSRATLVVVKQGSHWVLAHEHFSRLPDEDRP